MKAFKANLIYTGKGLERNSYLVVEKDKILGLTKKKPDCEIVECEVVTPAFIDAHSHIGLARSGEPEAEEEANDILDQIQPLNNPLNSVYFDDKALSEAVEFGVLYSILVPGSGNVLGGQAVAIRNFSKSRKEALLKQIGFKLALGFNPRSTQEWKGARPSTRMGVYALLEKKFSEVLQKIRRHEIEKKRRELELFRLLRKGEIEKEEVENELRLLEESKELELTPDERCLLQILRKEKILKVHAHKTDDLIYLTELKKKFGLKVVAEHLCDVATTETFNFLAENEIPITYGPLDAFPYKVELKHETYKNVKKLVDSKAFYCLMSDHPVTLARNLFLQLRFFLKFGLKKEEAISLLTFNAARINGLEELGSLEKGKLASFVLWEKDPFQMDSFPKALVMEGEYKEVE